ncbi:MAG: response regulator [Acidobacteriota bacterium]
MPIVIAAITDIFFLAKVIDAIKTAGGEMKLARTADEALEHARVGADLLILDLNDRAFPALDVATAMRADEQLKSVPVVAFLSHVQADLKQKAVATGINEVLARSVFSSSLPSVLKRYIG